MSAVKRKPSQYWPWIFFLAWIAWLLGVWVHGFFPNLFGRHFDFQQAGEFGDAFGPLSALMAALAAVGAWFALRQAREQAFEATFYSLLEHHNSIVAGTDIQAGKRTKDERGKFVFEKGTTYIGRDAYRRLLRTLRLTVAGMKAGDDLDRVREGYRRFFDKNEDELAHYLRTLYHIVLYVHKSSVDDKILYMRIIRAQLSNSEQILLLYNVTVGKGFWKFKALAEEYSLLHNVRFKEDAGLWEAATLKPLMDPKAFREQDADTWPTREEILPEATPIHAASSASPKTAQRSRK
jgi:hypothetical protein